MITFQLKTYNEKNEETQPHFYILCKGLNSGKPLEKPCPNCFCCVCENEEAKQKIYWLSYGLWQGRSTFLQVIRGTAIPFITIQDCKIILRKAIQKATVNPSHFSKGVEALQLIKTQEENYAKLLRLLDHYKLCIIHKHF